VLTHAACQNSIRALRIGDDFGVVTDLAIPGPSPTAHSYLDG
jgi:hypothetical protein